VPDRPDGITRRSFLARTSLAAGAAAVGTAAPPATAAMAPPHRDIEELTIAEMQAAMEAGDLTALELTQAYLDRIEVIDRGPTDLRSFNDVNRDARAIARSLDRERRQGTTRGPLHGIPIVIKENIDTDDAMPTTAGSLALLDSRAGADATVAARLRDAGAVIIGKANLSEWANFRSFQSSSGWSARGGQCRNPYVLDRNPCGSSSGSGAAVAANLAAASLGTETDGSIVCPATTNGVAGIKPSVGLTSRAGVVPISRSQDTVGPLGRTVADAAAVMGPLTGVDPRDPFTAESVGNSFTDYTQFLDPDGLAGARIGVARELFFFSPETEAAMEEAIAALGALGATVVDPISFPSFAEFAVSPAEFDVLLFEFKTDIALYLETRVGGPKMLADLIAFNNANAAAEMTWFGQEIFELSETFGPLTDPAYAQALADSHRISRDEGLDAVLDGESLDAIVAPTGSPSWPIDLVNGDHFLGGSSSYAAMAGYPLVTVPMGTSFGLPVWITFMGRAWSEPTLIKLASGFEAGVAARTRPEFLSTLPDPGPTRPPRQRSLTREEALDLFHRH
jgi:amidase